MSFHLSTRVHRLAVGLMALSLGLSFVPARARAAGRSAEACSASYRAIGGAWRDIYSENPETLEYAPQFLEALASYRAEDWQRYLRFVVEDGDSLLISSNRRKKLMRLIEKMPASLREDLLKTAGALYPAAPKRAGRISELTGRRVIHILPPKRSLDVLITELLGANDQIMKDLDRGTTASEALSRYLSSLQRQVFRDSKEYGRYGAKDVMDVARAIQKQLKVVRGREPGREEPYVVLGGSFPNGRANLAESDFDIAYSTPRLNRVLLDPASRTMPPETPILKSRDAELESLTQSIHRAVPKTKRMRIEAVWRPYPSHEYHEHFLMLAQPLTIKITPTQIELHVRTRAESLLPFESKADLPPRSVPLE